MTGGPRDARARSVLSGAEAVARVERGLVGRGFASDPAVAEGAALAGIRAASLSDGAALSASDRIPLPGVSCVHHLVGSPARARGTVFELAATSVQQAIDHCLVAHVASARLQRTGLCSIDPRLAERLELVSLPDLVAGAKLLEEASQGERHEPDPHRVLEEIRRALAQTAACTGRAAAPVEYDGEAGADLVFAAVGADGACARDTARRLRDAGASAAALSVVLVHPFPEDEVRAALAGASTVVLVQSADLGSTVPTRLRASIGDAAELRVVAAGRPERLLEAVTDLLEPRGIEPRSIEPSEAPPPRWRLGVVPPGPWGEQALREVLAATSRVGPLRMGECSRLERGATWIDWEGPGGPDENADLLIASHPAVLEPDALTRLRPGGKLLFRVSAASDEEALRELPHELLDPLREGEIRLYWVSPPAPEEPAAESEESEPGSETERTAALVLSGAAVAVVGGAERAREAFAGEDEVHRRLGRGAEGVRTVDPARLEAVPPAEEIAFRSAARRPRLPAADSAESAEERARWARAIDRFHRTGRAPVCLGPRLPLRPAVFDELVARLRHDPVYPLVVSRTSDAAHPLSVRPLHELLAELVAAQPEASVLRTNLGAVAPMAVRLLREAGGRLRLDALRAPLVSSLGRELGLKNEEAAALERELESALEALPADAWVSSLRDDLPVELHAAAVAAVRAPLRAAFHARLRTLRDRLRDQLELDRMSSPEGHSPKRLAAELGGGGALRLLDPEALSRTLPQGPSTLAPDRRRRIEEALAVIEAELAPGEESVFQTLYFTPPGLELPAEVGLQCEHPDPLAAAVGCFDGAALRMAPLFRAVRIAELELEGHYRPERHDALLSDLDWQSFTAEELALVPPVAVVTNGRRLRRRALGSLSDLLQSSRPVHVLVRDAVVTEDEAEDPSRFHLDLGYLVMAHREAFAVASSLARPDRAAEALARMARAPRPGVAVVQLPSPGLEPWYPLLAEAALQGRACPEFVYDPDAGASWAGRFDVGTNPQPDGAWAVQSLEYGDAESAETLELAFTFAEAVALEPACARHIHGIPRAAWDDELQRPVAEYLERFDPEGRDRSVPFLWVLDDAGVLQRAVISRALAMAVRDRLRGWRVLQELAGYQNAYAERAAATAREQALADAARERTELERAHAEALAGARSEGARESMERLAAVLLRGEVLAGAAPAGPTEVPSRPAAAVAPAEPEPSPVAEVAAPAEEEEESLSLDEAYVDSPLCTSCNECTDINNRMFQYNADKQAFLADPAAGTFAELVKAAEQCPARCIHPGKPREGDATATPELIERAAAFA